MDRFKGMEYFKRIVELGSFTAVADELDCSNAVISKYVKFMEEWVGCKLINRNTRTISFTEEGREFYRHCVKTLEANSRIMDSLTSRDGLSGQLVIACPVSLSIKMLAPLLFAFQQRHPGLQVKLRMSDTIGDLVGEGVDIAIRGVDQLQDSSLVALRLGPLERSLVASSQYLNAQGRPEKVEDLKSHACLLFSIGSDSQHWEFDAADGEQMVRIPVAGPLVADNSLMLLEGVKANLGIALMPTYYIHSAVAAAEVEVLRLDLQPTARSLYAVYADRQYLPKRTRLFIDFLKAHFAG